MYHSAVLAADIRMLPAAARDEDVGIPDESVDLHRLQWWDPNQGLWRDREVDAKRKVQEAERKVREAERKVRGAHLDERITSMHSMLKTKLSGALLAQIVANWRRTGQGRTTAEVMEVWLGKADWRSLQFPDQPDSRGSG